ncbi:MAG: hypothetical protein FJZ61_03110 [Chlamydiae bacterium]|nr:hypothetical protein [Chlamydiota bacterium]
MAQENLLAYLLTVSYDGTNFYGWFCHKNRNLQDTILKALKVPVKKILVASRTDRGVHAEDQKILILIEKNCPVPICIKKIRSNLPPDINILSLTRCDVDFHPSLNAKQKEYHYRFHLDQTDPFFGRYSLPIGPINLTAIQAALPFFSGYKNFSALEGAKKRRSDPFCDLFEIDFIQQDENRFFIKIVADRFLYLMCRKIAGTLLYIGYGKLSLSTVERGFELASSKNMGPTLPPAGLILKKITYDRDPSLFI